MNHANNPRTESSQGRDTGVTHFTLTIPAAALALRALRPSPRARHLPVRVIRVGVEAFKRDACGYNLIPVYREVPVYTKHPRSASSAVEAYLSH